MNIEYYLITKSICLDSNQWSIFIGIVSVFLTILGFVIAFIIYKRQRSDNACDAFNFFQGFLPPLKDAVTSTIESLEEFDSSLKDSNDNFRIPVLYSSLSDRFLNKINIVDLNRYYLSKNKIKHEILKSFIVNSNFIGDYLNYFTTQIDFFREHYKEKENIYSEWQLLRSNKFFASVYDNKEDIAYKSFYANWVKDFNNDTEIFEFNEDGIPQSVISRKLLVSKHIDKLRHEVFPFIAQSEKANEINLIANKIVMAYEDIELFKNRMSRTISQDLLKFKEILEELNNLME
ncbi:hypothetical protein [uncultured Flavobacterium sp.]|uniref:hypothetical protein n=1 Tax=uncultured Flavobacterium sp. TaxID=165435 RepID=UPI0025E45685|nr:hypothetical protein [uncultured Flavobacterium sp.]